jgi:hypothetical protein
LDGTKNQPKSGNGQKLQKRKTQKIDTENPIARNGPRMGGPGSVFRRRVPDEEGEIVVARQAHLQFPQTRTDQAKSHPDQLRHRLGRSGFGLERNLGDEGNRFGIARKKEEVVDRPRAPFEFGRVLKRVRFTPSEGSAGNLKRPAFRALNTNESTSKFYEKFDSKTNTAAS